MYTDLFRLFETKAAATEGPTGPRYTLQKVFDAFVSKSGVKTLRDYGDKRSTMISWILKKMQQLKNYLVQNLQCFCVEMNPMRSKRNVTMISEQNQRTNKESDYDYKLLEHTSNQNKTSGRTTKATQAIGKYKQSEQTTADQQGKRLRLQTIGTYKQSEQNQWANNESDSSYRKIQTIGTKLADQQGKQLRLQTIGQYKQLEQNQWANIKSDASYRKIQTIGAEQSQLTNKESDYDYKLSEHTNNQNKTSGRTTKATQAIGKYKQSEQN
jgi:hypothetical protein